MATLTGVVASLPVVMFISGVQHWQNAVQHVLRTFYFHRCNDSFYGSCYCYCCHVHLKHAALAGHGPACVTCRSGLTAITAVVMATHAVTAVMFTCGVQHWQDAVQELQLAGRSDQLLGVTGLVAGVQEEVGVVAGLAQMHCCIL